MRKLLATLGLLTGTAIAELPDGYWDVDRSQPILDATLQITLDPDLGHLTEAELAAVDELIEAGRILHQLYETQNHAQAGAAARALAELRDAHGTSPAILNLQELWQLFKGPIATTLDNERLPFVPASAEQPGRNFYPDALTANELSEHLEKYPESAENLLATRRIVRRATRQNLAEDIARLDEFPGIDALHADLRATLESLNTDPDTLYSIPYALAYAPQLKTVSLHLQHAAELLHAETPDFAAYLRNRARDLLTGDYESGDASWVNGDFDNLNLQIGSYETYSDKLRGVKAAYGASILARDTEKSRALESVMAGLQSIEDSLPHAHHKTVRGRIPVGVYNVIADFGQARGANTATILPNDADHTRKYGRTILLRYNIMTHPDLYAIRKQRFDASVDACCREQLSTEGGFNRTLWHEIGHYLGVARTSDGRDLDVALGDRADLLEEMKSDLVSLYAAPALQKMGYHDEVGKRAHYGDGIRRTLQIVRPRPDQPYQNMQLMQFNFFMENGLLEMDEESRSLVIHFDRYHEVVTRLLEIVLQVQYDGDYDRASEFVTRWNYWNDDVHEMLAQRMRAAVDSRFTLVRYRALQE